MIRTACIVLGVLLIGVMRVVSQEDQIIRNDAFEIRFSAIGITSLKHRGDVHDTEYIATGRALGADVRARYRKEGSENWNDSGEPVLYGNPLAF